MKLGILGVILSLFVLGACSSPGETPVEVKPEVVERIEVKTVAVKPPKPIVPRVEPLQLRNVDFIVITPENVEEKFAQIKSGEMVLFAVTADGYEALALNLGDIRAIIARYNAVIAVYEKSFN